MRRPVLIPILLAVLVLLAACAARREPAPGSPGSIWPPATEPGRLFYAPRFMASPRQAAQALWDAKHSYTVLGGEPVDLDASQRWLRVQVQIKVRSTRQVYHTAPWGRCANPASPLCDDYPDLVDVSHFERRGLVIPLDAVDRVVLSEGGPVRVFHEHGKLTEFRARDVDTQRLVADALVTLARPFGFAAEPSPGMTLADLTWSQRARLGVSSGVLVTGVERDSPEERAGIRYLDVVLEAGGRSADAASLAARLKALDLPGAEPLHLKLLHWRLDPQDKLDKTGPYETDVRGPWSGPR